MVLVHLIVHGDDGGGGLAVAQLEVEGPYQCLHLGLPLSHLPVASSYHHPHLAVVLLVVPHDRLDLMLQKNPKHSILEHAVYNESQSPGL